MPRVQRIDIAGLYHVVNRGVEQRDVFQEPKEFEKFLDIMNILSIKFNIIIHSYCLMTNHFHLLIEIRGNKLSSFMRLLNSQYAIYFNKKNHRVGHLWQGRFKSWFITDEKYLYTLIKYIENNPVKAKMIEKLGDYKYSSYQSFIGQCKPLTCVTNSIILTNYSHKEAKEFFTHAYNPQDLEDINKTSSLVVSSLKKEELDIQSMIFDFSHFDSKKERNILIHEYYEKGFSQRMLAKYLDLTQVAVHKILNKKL